MYHYEAVLPLLGPSGFLKNVYQRLDDLSGFVEQRSALFC